MHVDAKNEDDDEGSPPPPPDGGWGWMVVFGSFMIHVVTDGVTFSFGIFYDEFLEYFKEDKSKTSWILSALVGITLCSGPLSGSLVNKFGCRAVTVGGAILTSICLIIATYARNVTFLIIVIGIGGGFGLGLIYLPAIVCVSSYFEKKRSLAIGIAVCGSGFGTFIFAPIITFLMSEYGWRGTILIISGLVLECIIFGLLFKEVGYDEVKKTNNSKNQPQVNKPEVPVPIAVTNNEPKKYSKPVSPTKQILRHHSVVHFPATNSNVSRMAFSQPTIANTFGSKTLRRRSPLDKPDILYQGSLLNIPSYKAKFELQNRTAEEDAFLEHESSAHITQQEIERMRPRPKLLDFSLLRDIIFMMFTFSSFLTGIGFNIPYVYIVPRAKYLGLTAEQGGMLLSVIGISNTLGRIILGYISDKPWVNRLLIYSSSLSLCGLSSILSTYCTDFPSLCVYAAVFGCTIGVYVGLSSVILVDLLGLEKLTSAFGLLCLFQGIASLVGPPLGGALYDLWLSYDYAFFLSGSSVLLGGLMLFLLPTVKRIVERRSKKPMVPLTEM